jgi:putative tryptophan/tyrosine transport system substrate-binding protein
MLRRDFIKVSAASAALWPLAARAQPFKSPVRIGFLPLGSPTNAYDRSLVEAFRRGLRQIGLVEEKDIALNVTWITGDPEKAIAEVIQRGVDILVPCGSSASVAARRLTLTIPTVFISVGNPVGMGLVESLSRPARNVTGFSDLLGDLGGKLIDVAKELGKPNAAIDYLWHTDWPDGRQRLFDTEQAARSAGVIFRPHGVGDTGDLGEIIAAVKSGGGSTLIVQPSPFTYRMRERIIASAIKSGLPTLFAFPIAAREGALIAYGPDYVSLYQKAPLYIERIIRGTKPADLPVEQPTKVELVVNLRTAKALQLELPLSLLIRADELVE